MKTVQPDQPNPKMHEGDGFSAKMLWKKLISFANYGVVWYGTCGWMVWCGMVWYMWVNGMVWYGNGPAGQFWQMESALKFIQGFLSTGLLFE